MKRPVLACDWLISGVVKTSIIIVPAKIVLLYLVLNVGRDLPNWGGLEGESQHKQCVDILTTFETKHFVAELFLSFLCQVSKTCFHSGKEQFYIYHECIKKMNEYLDEPSNIRHWCYCSISRPGHNSAQPPTPNI